MKTPSPSRPGRLVLRLKNDLSELDTLCRRLERFARDLDLPPKVVAQINLVIEEVFTNFVAYGCRDAGRHAIRVAVFCGRRKLVIRIEDDGLPFNPVHSPHPDCRCPVNQRQVGNLGIHLVKQVMDRMIYKRRPGRNVLILLKRYDPPSE